MFFCRLLAAIFFCMACMALPCHAEKVMPTFNGTLDRAQIGLGNIQPGDSIEHVTELYGTPMMSAKGAYGGEVYSYQNGAFVITFAADMVQTVLCTQDGEMKTPDGVTVWQDEVVLDGVYGMASQIEERADGTTVYAYWGNVSAPYQYLTFTAKNGSIVRIVCGMA